MKILVCCSIIKFIYTYCVSEKSFNTFKRKSVGAIKDGYSWIRWQVIAFTVRLIALTFLKLIDNTEEPIRFKANLNRGFRFSEYETQWGTHGTSDSMYAATTNLVSLILEFVEVLMRSGLTVNFDLWVVKSKPSQDRGFRAFAVFC